MPSRHCAIVQVTTADALSVAETIETHAELSRIHLAPAAVFFNRMVGSDFDANDIAALANGRGARSRRKNLEHLAELAGSELRRGAEARAAIVAIRAATGGPVIELREHPSIAGIELIELLAADLARGEQIEASETLTD